MSFPEPKPGLVIRYNFLWSHEKAAGLEEGRKDRPAVIISAKRKNDAIGVSIAPITHSFATDCIAIPPDICANLGLDGFKQWVQCGEVNYFTWVGFDVRPIPGKPDNCYGSLPPGLFAKVRQRIVTLQKERGLKVTARDSA